MSPIRSRSAAAYRILSPSPPNVEIPCGASSPSVPVAGRLPGTRGCSWGLAIVGVLSIGAALALPAQRGSSTQSPFPNDAFQARVEVAAQLAAYDRCGWVTSDLLVKQVAPGDVQKLGEWLCYQENGRWNAVYGRFDSTSDSLIVAVHFVADASGRYTSTTGAVPAIAQNFARAVVATQRRMPAAATGAEFNTFVREGPNGPEVWMLPAWQRNGWLVWGMELRYDFDSSGRSVRDSSVVLDTLRGARPDTSTSIYLVNRHDDVPSVGEIFFVMSYHKQFARVRVYTRRFVTELFDQKGTVAWLHVVRATTKHAGAGP